MVKCFEVMTQILVTEWFKGYITSHRLSVFKQYSHTYEAISLDFAVYKEKENIVFLLKVLLKVLNPSNND